MRLSHVANRINGGGATQHRLLLGKHVLAEGLERSGTEAEQHLGACFELYVQTKLAEDAAKKHREAEAKQSQGNLGLDRF